MFITINLDQNVIDYLDSVCGGPIGRANYIHNLIAADAQNQPQVTTYPEPEPEIQYNIGTPRLTRYQKGFQAPPEAPIKHRDRNGSIRRPRQSTTLKRGSG